MSKPTVEQLCELFRQIAGGMVTGDAVQETIEQSRELALSQLKQKITTQAFFEAKRLAAPEKKALVLVELMLATQNPGILDEVYELLSDISIPNMDLAGIVELTQDPQNALWAYEQCLRIVYPQRRAERLVELAVAFPSESDKCLIGAGESVLKIGDEGDRNNVRSQIVGSLAQIGRLALARKTAEGIGMSYWKAIAYLKIFRFSRYEGDYLAAVCEANHVTNYWASNLYKELTIVLSELGDFGKAWETLEKIEMRDWLPYAIVAIIKAAVKAGNESSIQKGMHMLLADEYRWWRTQGHLLIASGSKKKVSRDYLAKIRRSIILCQDAGHQAEASANLAVISRDPSDLEEAYKAARTITDPLERIKTMAVILKVFK